MAVYRSMACASAVVILCDGSKIGSSYFAQFATLDQIDRLITDHIDPHEKERLEEKGLDVIVAPPYADLKETLSRFDTPAAGSRAAPAESEERE